jgi:hypothetical protein
LSLSIRRFCTSLMSVRARTDISDVQKRRMLSDNAETLFGPG